MIKLDIPSDITPKWRKSPVNRKPKSELPDDLETAHIGVISDNVAIAAVSYAKLGWAVFPLHSVRDRTCTCAAGATCRNPGKHPIADGVHSATNDPSKVEGLWHKYPDANIGIATGKVSGIIVLDVDPRNGGRDTSKRLAAELGPVNLTAYSETGGGGYHRFFAYPDEPISTRHSPQDLRGIDLQSDGAYVVAPPSLHVSGQKYCWREQRDPHSIALTGLPPAWRSRLKKPIAPALPTAASETGAVIEGRRNDYLTKRAGALRRAGLSEEAMIAALAVENQDVCKPPLDHAEVAKIASSVAGYSVGPADGSDEAEKIMQVVLDQHFESGRHLMHASDGHFWAFDGSRWAAVERKVLSKIILSAIQSAPERGRQQTSSLMRQVLSLIEAKVAAVGDLLRFSAPPAPVINCRNGELWIDSRGVVELRAHRYDSYLRHRIEVDYDANAQCPRYDAALLEIFAKTTDPTAMADLWNEMMGYATQPDRRTPLIMLGWGSGNNGKTRLLETYIRLIGTDLVVAMPIGDIEKSRFMSGNLLGKFALIDDDVRAGTRLPDGQLKRLSEEKTMTGENKFGPLFTFTSRTAIFMLFNNPPTLADLSPGMQRRLIVVPFNRVFSPNETDKGLFQAIWRDELSGVLNRYTEGLKRVVSRNWDFAPPQAAEQAKAELLNAANPVPAFIHECCEKSGSIYVQALYDAYKEWAQRSGITITPQRLAFQRTVENLGYSSGHGNRGPKLHGLKLREVVPAREP